MIDKNIEKQLAKLWGKVGLIIQISQMIEYNLANILAANEILKEFANRDSMTVLEYNDLVKKSNKWFEILSKSTMGSVIKRAKEVKIFKEKFILSLTDVLERRNYIVHQFFIDDREHNFLKTNPKRYFKYLDKTILLIYDINNILSNIFEEQKSEYEKIN